MIYNFLRRKNSLKIFFLNIFLLIIPHLFFSQSSLEIYKSNYNGLKLVKINQSEAINQKYVLYSYFENKNEVRRTLYENGKIIKKWFYYYTGDYLSLEKEYNETELILESRYNNKRHKIKKEDYKNNKKIKVTTYEYNSDGLVEKETVYNLTNNQTIYITYRYDKAFQIKQIERKYIDGKFIFWDCFFNEKRIIQKEVYTLKDEVYTFWYNEGGQETKGLIVSIGDDGKEIKKKDWENFYSEKGKKIKKIENEYNVNRKKIIFYNDNFLETRIETYQKEIAVSIETFEYNKDNLVTLYQKIEGLTSDKTVYTYDEKKELVKTVHYTNDAIKKIVEYNSDKSRLETIFLRDKQIQVKYDKDGKIIE